MGYRMLVELFWSVFVDFVDLCRGVSICVDLFLMFIDLSRIVAVCYCFLLICVYCLLIVVDFDKNFVFV